MGAGCNASIVGPQVSAGISAACAAGQIAAAAAQVNAAAMNKPGVASNIALGTQLASTDCTAALAAIAAAQAAAKAPASK